MELASFSLPLLWPERVEEAELDGKGSLLYSLGAMVVCCVERSAAGGVVVRTGFLGAMIVVVKFRWM